MTVVEVNPVTEVGAAWAEPELFRSMTIIQSIELVPSLVLVEVESTSQVDSHSFQPILQA